MSYVPTVWATGDVVTAEKLNKIENGISNALSATLIPFRYFDAFDSGGFVKNLGEGSPETIEYYTLAEIQALYLENDGMLMAYDLVEMRGASPAFISVGGSRVQWDLCVFYAPSDEAERLYFVAYHVLLTAEGYSIEKHSWYTAITNDD